MSNNIEGTDRNVGTIEEDIKIIKDNLFNIQKDTCLQLRISIENLINEYTKNKGALNLLNEMKRKYKIVLFMIIRNSIVMPKGKLLGKTEKEINRMSYDTLCELLVMTDFKIAEKLYKEGKGERR